MPLKCLAAGERLHHATIFYSTVQHTPRRTLGRITHITTPTMSDKDIGGQSGHALRKHLPKVNTTTANERSTDNPRIGNDDLSLPKGTHPTIASTTSARIPTRQPPKPPWTTHHS